MTEEQIAIAIFFFAMGVGSTLLGVVLYMGMMIKFSKPAEPWANQEPYLRHMLKRPLPKNFDWMG